MRSIRRLFFLSTHFHIADSEETWPKWTSTESFESPSSRQASVLLLAWQLASYNGPELSISCAAGSPSGESYILGSALKRVVERHYPKIRITLLETGGTIESLQMLEDGRAQLAAAQADVVPGPRARVLAVLYDDAFQLLVLKDSLLRSFTDLKGARIALAESGGQFQSFLRVAEHFGLHEGDFRFVGSSDEAAEEAILHRQADAIFRVPALANPSIQRLVRSGTVRFLPIEHAAAITLKYPAFGPRAFLRGLIRGTHRCPRKTCIIAVHRTLLASAGADEAAIRAITGVL